MRKVEKEMTSPTDEESAKCLLNLCGHQRTPWDPSDPSYELEIKEGRRFCKSPKRLIGAVRDELTEGIFAKWAFDKSAELY